MKKSKKVLAVLLAALTMSFALVGCGGSSSSSEASGSSSKADEGKVYNIGICQLVQHDALDAATKGFKDKLTESPIQDVYGRILYYAAWNAYYYKLPLLEMYPELAQDVLKIGISRKNMIPIYKQIAARIYVRKNGKR